MRKAIVPLIIIFLVILADQSLKFWIKTTMCPNDTEFIAGNWFILHFTENEGMAFGITIGDGEMGKVILSLFRIVAMIAIGVYLYSLIKKVAPKGLIISIALIFAGALGNIIDSAFYGLIFSQSREAYYDYTTDKKVPCQIAEFLPDSGGYSSFLHGDVVDMLYFPLAEGRYPRWFLDRPDWCKKNSNIFCNLFPWAGEVWIFFRPIFNIADASITVGVFLIIIFQKRYFRDEEDEEELTIEEEA